MELYINNYKREGEYCGLDGHPLASGKLTPLEAVAIFYFNVGVSVNAERFLSFIEGYLEHIATGIPPTFFTGQWFMILSFFDDHDIIEYGSSIRGSWLTEKGKYALQDIRIVLKGDNHA